MEGQGTNWSEKAEDLVHEGALDEAICLLESLVSKLETSNSPESDLQLSSALFDLAKHYSAKGFSLKADQIESRAQLYRQRSNQIPVPLNELHDSTESDEDPLTTNQVANPKESSEDDWEAIADCEPDKLISPLCLPSVSKLSLEDTKAQAPKRRGRGNFSYRKQGLYSDHHSDGPITNNSEDDILSTNAESTEIKELKYGTRHVVVLSDFPLSTKTIDLEKLLEKFKDHGFGIRWVNDALALAVFRTPSTALEVCNSIKFPFKARVLDENDDLLSSIPARDLEPPKQRPESSARTARRLIANGMGLKLPSSESDGFDLRKQEVERKKRIINRQNLKDSAWGDDNLS